MITGTVDAIVESVQATMLGKNYRWRTWGRFTLY